MFVLRPGIKGIISDLDGTLYKTPPEEYELFREASVTCALRLGFNGTRAKARALLEKEWHERNDATGIALARDHGVDRLTYTRARHAEILPIYLTLVQPDAELTSAFNRLARRAPIGVVTHASQEWGEALPKHLKMKPHHVLGIDHPRINFRKKNESPEPFLAAAEALGLEPEEIAVLEDTDFNLLHPRKLGMQTILVTWEAPLAALPEHIDAQVRSIRDVHFAMAA